MLSETMLLVVNVYGIGFMFTLVLCYYVDLQLSKGEEFYSQPVAWLWFSSLWFVTIFILMYALWNSSDDNFPDDY